MDSIDALEQGDALKSTEERLYSRADFLRINTVSVQSDGNNKLFERLKLLQDANKSDEKMKDYPHFQEVDLTKKEDLNLLAWVVETFMAFVCKKPINKEERGRSRTLEFYDALFEHMTLDDLVFMFVQVQNNINKWKLVWEAFKRDLVPAWRNHGHPEDCECTKKSLKGKPEFEKSLELVTLINSRARIGCCWKRGEKSAQQLN